MIRLLAAGQAGTPVEPPVEPPVAAALRQAAVRSRMASAPLVSIPAEGRTDRIWMPSDAAIEGAVLLHHALGGGIVTQAAAFEHPDTGAITPFTWDGQPTTTVPIGGYTYSDPLPVTLPAGGWWLRAFIHTSDATAALPEREALHGGLRGEGRATGNHTATGVIPTTHTDRPNIPLGVLSATYTGPAVAVIGDSIAAGTSDKLWSEGIWLLSGGYVDRGLLAAGIPYRNYARGGENFKHWRDYVTGTLAGQRYADLVGITHLVIEMGANQMGDSPGLYGGAIACGQWAKALGVSEVWYTTQTPQAHSTDGWTTTANQTHHVWGSVNISDRIAAFNDWLRDGAPTVSGVAAPGTTNPAASRVGTPGHWLDGVIEVADTVESARNSGYWRVDLGGPPCDDYIHPNEVGHVAAAAAVQEWAETHLSGWAG